ncbi:MAG: hypothetical protein HYR96_00240 [Deltaproteobacteria bacterium]|nr:hypothetical protein [Deltaproteobacteria bacterium]MBI3293403.1 hypothetical protein [Deltaproteobacteria bacterium]
MFQGVCLLFVLFIIGCAEPPPSSLFSSLVLAGSVNPKNTIGLGHTRLLNFAKELLFGLDANAAGGYGNPTQVLTQFYRFYVSDKDDCSSLTVATDYGALGLQKDMTFNPILFAARPDEADYKCIAIEMDDTVYFRPDTSGVNAWAACTDVTMQYTSDLYRSDDTLAWTDPAGNAIAARGTQLVPITDRIFLYASTTPARVTNGVVKAPASQVLQLTKTLEVPTSFVFYTDFASHVNGSGSVCHLDNPTYGVR